MYTLGSELAESASRMDWLYGWSLSGIGFRVALSHGGDFYDPRFAGDGLVDSAQFAAGPISPGLIVSIFGTNIGPVDAASMIVDDNDRAATELRNTQLLFDGRPAPLIYVSRNQVNAIVPTSVAGKASTEIMVKRQGQTSMPVTIPVAEVRPVLFTLDGSGSGQAAALNQDSSLNSTSSPAPRDSVISLFATGTGPTSPSFEDGQIVRTTAPSVLPVRVAIGGVGAEVQYAGGAPGLIYGATQINARVPAGAATGPQTVTLSVNGIRNPGTVTVAIA
jgi:uncharacterized protein (TIGR03437 family)